MTSAQVAEGQRLSRDFVAKKESRVPRALPAFAGKAPGAGEEPKTIGTGFFVTTNGYVLTSYHVVEDATRLQVRCKAGVLAAKLVKADAANDIAVIKMPGSFTALPIAPSRGVRLGDSVFTIGFPNVELQGFEPKLTKGEISGLSGVQDDPRHFQISVPVQPGNSGGALASESGAVIGVIDAKLSATVALRTSGALPENVNYALKSSYALLLLESIPDAANKLIEARLNPRPLTQVFTEAENATVLVLAY
jgi:S1-C subfamily serine protease